MDEIDASAMMADFNAKKHRAAVVAVAKDEQKEQEIANEATEKTGEKVVTGHSVVNKTSTEEDLEAQLAASLSQESENKIVNELQKEEKENADDDIEQQLAYSMMACKSDNQVSEETVGINEGEQQVADLESQLAESLSGSAEPIKTDNTEEIVEDTIEDELAASIISENTTEEVAEPVEEVAEPVEEVAEPVEEVAEPVEEVAEYSDTNESELSNKDSIINFCKENIMDIIEEYRHIVQFKVKERMETEGLPYDIKYVEKLISVFGEVATEVFELKLFELESNGGDTEKISMLNKLLEYAS